MYIKTTLTIQFKITLNLKHSMNNKKNIERKRRKKNVPKKEKNNLFIGDFYAFRYFDKREREKSVYRTALNVVSIRNLENESILKNCHILGWY